MRGHDPKIFGLLPALGLCSCVVASERDATVLPEEALAPTEHDSRWIESDSPHQPLTTVAAATLSGRAALAARDFRAASASLTVAIAYEPALAELRFDKVDALVGLGEFEAARNLLTSMPDEVAADPDELERAIDSRRMVIREREHGFGFTPCDAKIDAQRRPLTRREDFVSAWNDLRAGLPKSDEIPIPTTEDEARDALCGTSYDCDISQPLLVRMELELEATVGLVVPNDDGSVSVLPELLHPVWTSCGDDTALSLERHGDLLRVRAFTDAREEFDPSDWELDGSNALGSSVASSGSQSSGYYASSGYASSGYGSSGYASSGYNYNYGHGYGCSGYDDSYDYEPYYCAATRSVERDVFIDLASGEVVLDIVRTGVPSSPLGAVELQAREVRVEACGIQDSIALSWTQA